MPQGAAENGIGDVMKPATQFLLALAVVLVAFALNGCAPALPAPPEPAPERFIEEPELMAEPAAPPEAAPPVEEAPPPAAAPTAAVFRTDSDTLVGLFQGPDRLIIKNGEVKLLVSDTDVAIDRLTQIVGDTGGYIVSSREWFQEHAGENFKYATFTFSVPVRQFERTLRRLRDLAVRVLDERASGEDVTEEFVDLESRLRNLEATRDRIREFLDAADTVEEALEVNEQLSSVEAQIEEIKGRMNFLSGRAAFSTITAMLEPELPEIEPSPTPTPTATPTPSPTPTPTPWNPGATFTAATTSFGSAYRAVVDLSIWFAVCGLPILAPTGLAVWLVRRRTKVMQGEEG